jgi:cellulose synthase/poly-beta-1,6-N-acetylglucosamine synthase-like glycosyltransferase
MVFLVEAFAFFATLMIVIYSLAQAGLAYSYSRSKSASAKPAVKPVGWAGQLPRVLIQLPIYNEQYVVERLLNCMAQIDYPKDKLSIQLLDDSSDETTAIAARVIAELKSKGVKIDHVRRPDRKGFKAGALQYGLSLDDSEFIAIFDADFLPRPDFIKQVVAYFGDPKVGMVQTRWEHLNLNYSLITRLMGFAIDNHFSVEQGGRQASDNFINFNGTGGMWRRATIEDAGGWESDCLTEDLDLSFRSQIKGWKFLFVESITTPSELPVEMSAVRSQQFRWTKGAAETGKKTLANLWASNAPLMSKIVGSFHMLNSLVFLFMHFFVVAMLLLPWFTNFQTGTLFWVLKIMVTISFIGMIYTFGTAQKLGEFTGQKQSFLHIVMMTIFFTSTAIGLSFANSWAIIQAFTGKVTPFVRTPKLNILKKDGTRANNKAYVIKALPPAAYVEILYTLIFVGMIIYCLPRAATTFIEVYAYFALGFGFVAFHTLKESFGR